MTFDSFEELFSYSITNDNIDTDGISSDAQKTKPFFDTWISTEIDIDNSEEYKQSLTIENFERHVDSRRIYLYRSTTTDTKQLHSVTEILHKAGKKISLSNQVEDIPIHYAKSAEMLKNYRYELLDKSEQQFIEDRYSDGLHTSNIDLTLFQIDWLTKELKRIDQWLLSPIYTGKATFDEPVSGKIEIQKYKVYVEDCIAKLNLDYEKEKQFLEQKDIQPLNLISLDEANHLYRLLVNNGFILEMANQAHFTYIFSGGEKPRGFAPIKWLKPTHSFGDLILLLLGRRGSIPRPIQSKTERLFTSKDDKPIKPRNNKGDSEDYKSQSKFVLSPADKNYTLFESIDGQDTTYVLSLRDRQYNKIIEFFEISQGSRQNIIDFVKSCQEAYNTLGKNEDININNKHISFIRINKIAGVKNLAIFGTHPVARVNPYGYFYPQNMKRILNYFGVDDK